MKKFDKTEDDTFRVLKRPPVEEMFHLYKEWHADKLSTTGLYSSLHNIEFAKYYGWEWEEYLIAKKRWLKTF